MKRYCLGPLCRDLKPLAIHTRYGGNTRYCESCRREVRRRSGAARSKRYRRRHAEKVRAYRLRAEVMAKQRVWSLARYHRQQKAMREGNAQHP